MHLSYFKSTEYNEAKHFRFARTRVARPCSRCYMYLRTLKRLLLAIIAFALSACGTVGHGTHQKIKVFSNPEGAKFTVSPSGLVGVTPTEIELKRSMDHEIYFEHDKYESKKVYVRRTLSRGAGYSNAFVPFVGIIGLGIDAATGAQFNLMPSPVNVDLTIADSNSAESDYSEVVFFNGNKSGTVNIVFESGEECRLKKKQYSSRKFKKGTYNFEFYHWDMFKFADKYQIKFDENSNFIAVFSSTFGTHFAFDTQGPKEFEEACSLEKAPNNKHSDIESSVESPIRTKLDLPE